VVGVEGVVMLGVFVRGGGGGGGALDPVEYWVDKQQADFKFS